jgi:hypothetical protein
MVLNFEKLSKNSNRLILEAATKLGIHLMDEELKAKVKKIKPTAITIQERIFLENLIFENRKIVQKL